MQLRITIVHESPTEQKRPTLATKSNIFKVQKSIAAWAIRFTKGFQPYQRKHTSYTFSRQTRYSVKTGGQIVQLN